MTKSNNGFSQAVVLRKDKVKQKPQNTLKQPRFIPGVVFL
jgi:hypothetical protein